MEQRLIANHRLQAERPAGVGQAKLNANGIAGMKLPGQHQADPALTEGDRTPGDGIRNS
jgi:hypothetical protein